MRKTFIFFAVALAASLTSGAAHANVLRPLGKHTVGDVRKACSGAGGQFVVQSDGGGYGCTKKNCDGKGGYCQVSCDNNNNCNGSTPDRRGPKVKQLQGISGISQVLGNWSAPSPTKPSAGILDAGAGMSRQGPAPTGTPSKPAVIY